MAACQDLSLPNIPTDTMKSKHSPEILNKIKGALNSVAGENGSSLNTALTADELTDLVYKWEPQRDLVCLYVRWARQLKHNFNFDSIATLMCLSRQTGYTPVDFLQKVKTLFISKHQKATCIWSVLSLCYKEKRCHKQGETE